MSRKLLVPLVAVVVALGGQVASAKTVTCSMASFERTVELRYDNPGEAVPCEIRYAKPDEGVGEEVLWRAENEAGYCEARFQAFVDKLRGFGWSCGTGVDAGDQSTAAAGGEAPVDDEPAPTDESEVTEADTAEAAEPDESDASAPPAE